MFDKFLFLVGLIKSWFKSIVGTSAKGIGLVGDGVVNDAIALNTWIASIGSEEVDLILEKGTYLISTNVVFPANVNIVPRFGAVLKVSNTFSITGTNTKLDCGLWQCFDLSLGGTVGGNWEVGQIYPEWFGAIGDGVTDDTGALQKAIIMSSTSGSVCTINSMKTILITNITITNYNNININCLGTIKRKDNTNNVLLTFTNCNNLNIPYMRFDGNAYNNGADEAVAYPATVEQKHNIKISGGKDISLGYIYAKNTCGDVIYITDNAEKIYIQKVEGVNDTIIGRNVVSLIYCNSIHIDNIIGEKYGHYTMPGCFDIEPNLSTQTVKNVYVGSIIATSSGSAIVAVLDTNNSTVENITIDYANIKALTSLGGGSGGACLRLCGSNVKVCHATIDANSTHNGVFIDTFNTNSVFPTNIEFMAEAKNCVGGLYIGYTNKVINIKGKFITGYCSSHAVIIGAVDKCDLDLTVSTVSATEYFIRKTNNLVANNVTITGSLAKTGTGSRAIGYSGDPSYMTNWTLLNVDFTGWTVATILWNGTGMIHPTFRKINCKGLNYSASIPTTGIWVVGDIVYNTTPTAGGYMGWTCITAGEAGTWKGFGLIQA